MSTDSTDTDPKKDKKRYKAERLIYTVSIDNLVESWASNYHSLDHVVIVWDALNHKDFLKEKGFNLDEAKIYNNKILTIQVNSLDKALETLNFFFCDNSPYAQVYSLGKFITDNIDK